MTQYGFYFDSTRCTGCRTCEMACKDYNDLPANYAFRRVFDYEGGDWKDNGDGTFEPTSWAYHVSMACNHCAMPAWPIAPKAPWKRMPIPGSCPATRRSALAAALA